jgi:hypothetical protein
VTQLPGLVAHLTAEADEGAAMTAAPTARQRRSARANTATGAVLLVGALALGITACGRTEPGGAARDAGDRATREPLVASGEPSPRGTQAPVESAPPSSARTERPAAATFAGPVVEIDGALPGGAPPAIAWAHGRDLHRPDAPAERLPQRFEQLVLVGDVVLGVRGDDEGRRLLSVLGRSGKGLPAVSEIVDSVVVSPSGTSAAWSTTSGELMTLWDDSQVSFGDGTGPVSPAAVLGDGSCYEVDGGCLVFFNDGGRLGPQVASSHGIVDQFAPNLLRVDDAARSHLVAVRTSTSDTGSCSAVWDLDRSDFRWRTCDHSLLRFSPDGRNLLGTEAYRDGLGLSRVTVLDAATGKERMTYRVRRGHIAAQAWEDPAHVLLVTYGDRGWRVIRVDLAGHAEEALVDTGTTDEVVPPFVLAGNR